MRAMLQLILIRPGSTDYDVQERIQGSLDMPLNERGQSKSPSSSNRFTTR